MQSSKPSPYSALFAFDFDGTLRPSGGEIPREVCSRLKFLGETGTLRVIATGRSLYSLFKVISDDFPVEYVVFSSGAGILRMNDSRVIMSRGFCRKETERITRYLLASSYDFMVHHPIPENHRFFYHHSGGENEDFFRRCDLYFDHAHPYSDGSIEGLEASQFLIVDPEGESTAQKVQDALGESVSVVRATSPIDHSTAWIEIFPPGTDKGSGVQWLAEQYHIPSVKSGAVGNDYNDLHLLEWAGYPYVVANAPEELKYRFPVVSSCAEGGAAEAVSRWLSSAGEEK